MFWRKYSWNPLEPESVKRCFGKHRLLVFYLLEQYLYYLTSMLFVPLADYSIVLSAFILYIFFYPWVCETAQSSFFKDLIVARFDSATHCSDSDCREEDISSPYIEENDVDVAISNFKISNFLFCREKHLLVGNSPSYAFFSKHFWTMSDRFFSCRESDIDEFSLHLCCSVGVSFLK